VWQMKAEQGEIIKSTNLFHRRLRKIKSLQHLRRGERKKVAKFMEKGRCNGRRLLNLWRKVGAEVEKNNIAHSLNISIKYF